MSKRGRSLRLVPLVVLAAASLFVLKAFGLITAGTHSLGGAQPAYAQPVYAQTSDKPMAEVSPSRGKGDRAGSAADRGGTAPADGSPPAPRKSWMQEVFDYPEFTGSVAAPGEKNGSAPAPDESPIPAMF